MLYEHSGPCSPFDPCGSCQAIAFIKEKLSEEDFNTLTDMILSLEGSQGKTTKLPKIAKKKAPLDTKMDSTGFSCRVGHVLRQENIITLEDALKLPKQKWLHVPNFGKSSLREVEIFIRESGYGLGELAE